MTQTTIDSVQDATISQLLATQAAATPDAIALVFEQQQLSYRQLDRQVNQLAAKLQQLYRQTYHCPLTPDTLIALYFDTSVTMVVSLLAVLKAGGAYVPLSAEQPMERNRFVLADTKAAFVLTSGEYVDELNLCFEHLPDSMVVDVEQLISDADPDVAAVPVKVADAISLAYMIYTSGTTGQPKGVMGNTGPWSVLLPISAMWIQMRCREW